MIKYLLVLSVLLCLFVVNIKCDIESDIFDYNITELGEELHLKNDDADCSGMGGTVAKIMLLFSKIENPPIDPLRVKFNLYTKKSPNRKVQIEFNDNFNLNSTNFDITRKTVFIIHGFMTHGAESWIQKMKNAYLDYEDVNVIVVDWARYSFVWNYYRAIINALAVGRQTSQFISQITNAYPGNKKWGEIHMIGHSLGAHACGLAANEIKKIRGEWKVTRITGLDPAQPCFVGTNLLLDKNDAPFVDVIHTNGRKMIAGVALGHTEDMGHVDVYVNGGYHQPSCVKTPLMLFPVLKTIVDSIREAICSHMISIDYFTESLTIAAKNTKVKFWAHKWNGRYDTAVASVGKGYEEGNCIEMGIECFKYPLQGKFFVTTSKKPPYCGPISESDKKDVVKQLDLDHQDGSIL